MNGEYLLITAISQQSLYNTFDKNLVKYLYSYITIIINYFETIIKSKINWISSYSFDFAIINDNDENIPYFIELNGFGSEYSAGSTLFHWIHDNDKLYGTQDDKLYVRYTYSKLLEKL